MLDVSLTIKVQQYFICEVKQNQARSLEKTIKHADL